MRIWARAALFVAFFVALAYAGAFVLLRGERLGRAVTEGAWPVPGVNPIIRGRLEIERIDWSWSAPLDWLLGKPVLAKGVGIRVLDPRGQLCLKIPEITIRLSLGALLSRGDFEIEHAHATRATVVLLATPIAPPAGAAPPAEPETEIGLLAAFEPRLPSPPGRGPRFDIRDLSIDHVDFDLQQTAWRLRLPDASLAAGLNHAGGDVSIEGLPFFVRNRSPLDAHLTVLGRDFVLRGTRFDRFEAARTHPKDLRFALSAVTEGAGLTLQGALTSMFSETPGVDAKIGLLHAAPMLTRLSGLPIGGDVTVDAAFTGLLRDPAMDVEARDATLVAAGIALEAVQASVRIQGSIVELRQASASLLDGRATARGRLDMLRGVYQADLSADGIQTASLLPALAGRLDGTVGVRGPLDGKSPVIAEVDVTLSLDRRSSLPRRLHAAGTLALSERTLSTDDFSLSTSGASLRLHGSAGLDTNRIDLRVRLSAEDPSRLVPGLTGARGLAISGALRGPMTRPTASGTVALRSYSAGPLLIAGLSSPFSADLDSVALPEIRAHAHGAVIRARANLADLSTAARLDARGTFEGLDPAALTTQAVMGRVSGGFQITGTMDDLAALASLRAERLEAGGTTLEDIEASARLDKGAVVLDDLRARSGKATLSASGRMDADGTLAGTLDVAGFSLDRTAPLPMGGTVTGRLALAGTLSDPRLSGVIDLFGFRLRDADLGDGRLTFREPPAAAPGDTDGEQGERRARTIIEGAFFGDRLRVAGTLWPHPLALDAVLTVHNFDLTGPLPEMRERGFVSAPATGRIALSWDLANGLTSGDFGLASFRVTHRDDRGEIVIENQVPVQVRYRNGRATVARARLVSPAGEFSLEGWIQADDSNLRLRGDIKLELLQMFWSRFIASAQGIAHANLWLRGPPDRPTVVGALELSDARFALQDLEQNLEVPQGRLIFNTDQLVLENLVLKAGSDQATFDGHLQLANLRPTTLDVAVKGTVAADLLQMLLREHVSAATGRFALSLRASGPWSRPTIMGEIHPKQVEIAFRRVGRIVQLSGGALRLDQDRLRFDGLSGLIDEGAVKLDGLVRLDGLRIDFLDLRLVGENLPHRVAGQYEAELNLDVRLSGATDALVLDGRVDLVDARYTRDFQVTRLVLRPKVVEEQPPFWRGIPAIERMTLALHVTSRGAVGIRNNVADIGLGVALDVGGHPDEPTLEGEVRAEEGTFHLPLLKGLYTVDGGGVAFVASQPVDSARVRIEGTSIVPDRTETEHEVRLLLAGTLTEMQLSLSSPGLNPGQVLSLVATGRTTEQLRQELRGDEGGSGGGTASPGAAAADQSIKELTSDLFNVVVDPVGGLIYADTTRLEVGSESVHLLLCWRLLGNRAEACGEGDSYLAGGQRAEGRVAFRIDERLTAEANAEHLPQNQNAFESDLSRMRLQLRYRQRIRF